MIKGKLFVISAPSGTGKNTLVHRLLQEYPDLVQESISCTTRKPRPNEVAGSHYHFISEEEFREREKNDEFLETAGVFGNWYGTLKKDVRKALDEGKYLILVIDTEGAAQIMGRVRATFIFIMPPSFEALKERLQNRATETPEEMEKRLAWAREELEMHKNYDEVVVNDDLDEAYEALKKIIFQEKKQ